MLNVNSDEKKGVKKEIKMGGLKYKNTKTKIIF